MAKECKKCSAHKEALLTAWSEKARNLNPLLTNQQARQVATEQYYDLIGGREVWINKTRIKC